MSKTSHGRELIRPTELVRDVGIGGEGGQGPKFRLTLPQRQEQLTLEALAGSASRGRKEGCLALTALTWASKCHTCSIRDKTEAPGECPQAFPPGHQGGDETGQPGRRSQSPPAQSPPAQRPSHSVPGPGCPHSPSPTFLIRRECRLWGETAFAQNLPLLPASCVTLGRSPPPRPGLVSRSTT